MAGAQKQSMLRSVVRSAVERNRISGAVFYVSSDDNSTDMISAYGDMEEESQYYIASINKLFVSSIILRLNETKELDLNDRISKYLPEDVIRGLHMHKGKEYSYDLSIFHLISLTSGLPCYLTDRQADGKKAMAELEAGLDEPWPTDKVIRAVKRMKTHFPPGQRGRAKYVDTNHQILSSIIEAVTGEPVNMVLKNLFQELGLSKTYVCENVKAEDFTPIRYKSKTMNITRYLNSTKNDIISNAKDQMTFLKAFFNGYFFSKDRLKELEKWNNIFFPFKYGVGIQKFTMPRILSPFHPVPDMLGHCGSTGSVAFYIPDKKLYITGTINRQAQANIAFQTMIKIIRSAGP